jgi:hypothetical protein
LLNSDYASDIASEMADQHSPTSNKPFEVEEGLDFILSHFNEGFFPRTISTKATDNSQRLVYNKEHALAWFKAADWLDCKINAYPKYVEWEGINRQAPNFIFIDLDEGRFKSRKSLDRVLDKTLKNINEKFNDTSVYPTVIWSGHGYHIYLPVDAFRLEDESEFARFGYPSRKFLQFAEYYLSDNKADPCHTKGLSFKNCMIRIPSSFNSKKNGIKEEEKEEEEEEVKIIQRWNGFRPSIKPLLYRFDLYLLVSKSNELHKKKTKQQKNHEPKKYFFLQTGVKKRHDRI